MKQIHRSVFFVLLLCIAGTLSAQKTFSVYYSEDMREVSSIVSASYYGIDSLVKAGKRTVGRIHKIYNLSDGRLNSEYHYQNLGLSGMSLINSKTFHLNGKIKCEINYEKGVYPVNITQYWDNGNYQQKTYYQKKNLLADTCFDRKGNVTLCDIIQIASFPGGPDAFFSYLKSEMRYPEEDRENGVSGTVVVKFAVEEDGSISSIRIIQRVSPLIDAEAIRVVRKMPKWIPCIQEGKPVRTEVELPLTFYLDSW